MSKRKEFYDMVAGLAFHNNEMVKALEVLPGFEAETKTWQAIASAHRKALLDLDEGKLFEEVEARWSKAMNKATNKG